MTERIREFLRKRNEDGPCLVVDLDVVRDNYNAFAKALPDTRVFYAVKANPAPEVLALLAKLGSCFDTASISEIETGAGGRRHARPRFLWQHDQEGARHRARLRARRPPLRGRLQGRGGEGRPRGARLAGVLPHPVRLRRGGMAAVAQVRLRAGHGGGRAGARPASGLEPHGVSFHVGSQQRNQHAWDRALASAAAVFKECGERGINLAMVNLGGGFPTKYLKNVPSVKTYGTAIFKALRKHFGNRIPETIIEPGRGMVGNAGAIEAEVVLVSKKSEEDDVRWVYLDIGKFGGLAETMDESIRYPIRTPRDGDAMSPCVLAGPTCDSADVLYEKQPYPLPVSLEIGDKVLIEGTGAYTATYSSVAFNGFSPLKTYHI